MEGKGEREARGESKWLGQGEDGRGVGGRWTRREREEG